MKPDRQVWVALAVFGALGAIQLAGAFANFDHHGGKDWNSVIGQAQAELTTLRDFHQIPLWNPWRAGGQPSLVQPVSTLFSPATPLVLAFGVLTGLKLLLLPTFVVAGLGMWALAGALGLRGVARLVPGLVYLGASAFPLYLSGGLPNWLLAMAALPWLLALQRWSLERPVLLLATGAVWAQVLLCGAIDRFVFFPLLLGIDALGLAVLRRSPRPLFLLGGALVFGAALAGVRAIPLLEVYSRYPREVETVTRAIPPGLLPTLLLRRDPPDLLTLTGAWIDAGHGRPIYWINAGAYVGLPALLLAAAGALARSRRSALLLLNGAAFVWLCFGTTVSPSLWAWLHRLPVFGSMRDPERLMLMVLFFLALVAGFGFEALRDALEVLGRRLPERARPRLVAAALVAGLLVLVVPMLTANHSIAASAFIVEPPGGLRDGGLFQPRPEPAPFRQRIYPPEERQWQGPLFEPVLRNEGNLAGMLNIPIPVAAVAEGQPGYRGEVFLQRGDGQLEFHVTPNEISVRATLAAPDRLVVNQNYQPGWRADGTRAAPLEEFRGRLSLPLPAGRHELRLVYRPRSVALGAALSLAALAVGAVTVLRERRRGAARTVG